MKKKMTFTEVLESEYKYLIEAIEWGSSDPEVIKSLIAQLKELTGYEWKE